MRRLLVLVALYAGMQLMLPLGGPGQGSRALLAFGFVILTAYTTGQLAGTVGLPRIVGYLIAGAIFGPYVLGTVTSEAAQRLEPVNQLAVALIAFLAGAELRWHEVREKGVALLKVMTAELGVTFLVVALTLVLLKDFVPVLEGQSTTFVLSFVILFSAIAIVHSPAVTMALLTETEAKGPVARSTLGVVLLADVAVVLFFSATLAIARVLEPPDGIIGPSAGLVIWEITGALLVGAALGGAVAAYLRFVGRELVLFAVLVAFFGLELAQLLHVELLLTLLTAGFVAENVSEHGDALRHAMERSAAPIFVVFFALSGAKVDLGAVAPLLPLIVPIALVRMGGIWLGTRMGGAWGGLAEVERRYMWMGLVSQAGVAIGLAAIVADAYGEMGVYLQGLLLALIAVNETVGPILFRRALDRSGEVVVSVKGESADSPSSASRAGA